MRPWLERRSRKGSWLGEREAGVMQMSFGGDAVAFFKQEERSRMGKKKKLSTDALVICVTSSRRRWVG
jgi:hypothetical protein